MISRALFAVLFFAAAAAGAQAPTPPAAMHPAVDPANALSGAPLLEALRRGGFVLYMRHARQGKFTEACTEPNLTPQGEAEARKVGNALRKLQIPFGSVRASKLCRAIETAQLLGVGPVESTPDLNIGTNADAALHAARRKLLAEPPKPGANTILVSHSQSSANPDEAMVLQLCEIVVYRPDGRGGAVPVARVLPDEWESLGK